MDKYFKHRSYGTFINRTTAAILSVVIMISLLIIPNMISGALVEPSVNYPALSYFTEGSAPSADSVWKYYIRDYGTKPEFACSTSGFIAPAAIWSADDYKADISWESVSGADSYDLNIYYHNAILYTIHTNETGWSSTVVKPLEGGETYHIQIIAKDGDRQKAASGICIFKATQDFENQNYSYSGPDNELLEADTFSDDKLINNAAKTGYALFDNVAARRIIVMATSDQTANYGAHFTFVADKTAVYDFTGLVAVMNNSKVENATVYYRLVKTDINSVETVLTDGGDWLSLTVDKSNLNPAAELPVCQASLSKGDTVSLDVYQESAADDTVLDISLGNPTATVVNVEETYKGNSTTYYYTDYTEDRIYDDGSNMGKLTYMKNRWNTQVFKKDDSISYSNVDTMHQSWKLIYNKSVGTVGYYHSTKKVQIGVADTGVAFQFISPSAGSAVVNLPLTKSSQNVFVRILKDGVTIYPSGDWEMLAVGKSAVKSTCEVDAGSVISVEIYSPDKGATCVIDGSASVTVSDESSANNIDDAVFSPLWERPYNGKSYQGLVKFPKTSVFSFSVLDMDEQSEIPVDYYSSDAKMLYSSHCNTNGYIFGDKALGFAINDNAYGMSLSFTAPYRGYYDFSAALKCVQGTGTFNVRVLKNDETIWPESGNWQQFSVETEFPSMEIGALAGDKISFQLYADSCSNAIVSLGTPVIHRLQNSRFTQTGNITVYKPGDYTAFEQNYSGDLLQFNSRFMYSFNAGALPVTQTDSASRSISSDKNNYFTFGTDGTLTVMANAGNTAEIKFNAVMTGETEISLSVSQPANGAKLRILKNGIAAGDYIQTASLTEKMQVSKGDTLTLQISGIGTQIKLDNFSISQTGLHNNGNSAEDDGFYANYADPYYDEFQSAAYDGEYEKSPNDYWSFDFYNVQEDTVKPADYYSASDNHKIYRKEYTNTGYYFGAAHLTADINAADGYGIALGFTAPRADVFNTRYGLRVTTADSTVTLKYRIVKTSVATGISAQVWPSTGEWNEKTVHTDEDVTIPYAELTLSKGDTVYYEVYALSGEKNNITLNLCSPGFFKEIVETVTTNDISASIYDASNYSPYRHIDGYYSTYVPMDNRWNFYMADITDGNQTENRYYADMIRTDVNNDHCYYTGHENIPQLLWSLTNRTVNYRAFVKPGESVGTIMQFVCPYNGNIILNGLPQIITGIPIESASLKYRIVTTELSTGKSSTVWPSNGSDEWESITEDNSTGCRDIELSVKMGDIIEYQLYWDAPADALQLYLDENSLSYLRPEISVAATVTAVKHVDSERESFDAMAEFIPNYLLNPYWRVQYSTDGTVLDWKDATKFKSNYWRSNDALNIGISSKSVYSLDNPKGTLTGYDPVLAWLFVPKNDGYLAMSKTKQLYLGTSSSVTSALVRITVNGETVYPASGWTEVRINEPIKLQDVGFEVKAGDKIRFEVKKPVKFSGGEIFRFVWNPAFTISNKMTIYTQTNDIYNMLDSQMYDVFIGMDGSEEFDQQLAENKILSERIKKFLAGIPKFSYLTSSGDAGYGNGSQTNVIATPGKPSDYSEWEEEIRTPGGGWRKTVHYYITEWWVYALIIGGCIIGAAGITVFIIIFIKRRKLKKLQQTS